MPAVVFDPPRDLTPEERDVPDFSIEANARYSDKLRVLFVSHQWGRGIDRRRGIFWVNVDTDERRYQKERPADLTDDELDRV